ncbi:LysR family transcriptional regulator [Teichococcus wenyumeiae]|nr:LysR family transcriptional regulator [Pseudoroseomonas wenyumeiae]
MSINFEVLDLRALMAVLDLRSFSLAAVRLNMSQPALSRRIQRLEDRLGGPLLERTTRHVAPSALGQQVLPLLRHALNEMENALDGIEDLGGTDRGWVVVACLQTAVPYFMPPALTAFRALHPRVRVRILDMTAQEALQSVAQGEADFAITVANTAQDTDLHAQPLLEDPFVLACDAGHELARRDQLLWRELVDYPVIVAARTSVHRPLIQEALARSGLRLSWSYEVLHMSSAFHLIRAGLGVSVLPRIAMTSAGQADLRAIPLLEPVIHRPLSIVHRRSRPLSPAASCLAALVRRQRDQDGEGN